MIQMQTILEVADNSGAKSLLVITVLGQQKKHAVVGDIVSAAVEEALPDGTVKKGQRVKAVIVRSKMKIRRPDGSYLRLTRTLLFSSTKTRTPSAAVFSDLWPVNCAIRTS